MEQAKKKGKREVGKLQDLPDLSLSFPYEEYRINYDSSRGLPTNLSRQNAAQRRALAQRESELDREAALVRRKARKQTWELKEELLALQNSGRKQDLCLIPQRPPHYAKRESTKSSVFTAALSHQESGLRLPVSKNPSKSQGRESGGRETDTRQRAVTQSKPQASATNPRRRTLTEEQVRPEVADGKHSKPPRKDPTL